MRAESPAPLLWGGLKSRTVLENVDRPRLDQQRRSVLPDGVSSTSSTGNSRRARRDKAQRRGSASACDSCVPTPRPFNVAHCDAWYPDHPCGSDVAPVARGGVRLLCPVLVRRRPERQSSSTATVARDLGDCVSHAAVEFGGCGVVGAVGSTSARRSRNLRSSAARHRW
jgi:hypothetical protein